MPIHGIRNLGQPCPVRFVPPESAQASKRLDYRAMRRCTSLAAKPQAPSGCVRYLYQKLAKSPLWVADQFTDAVVLEISQGKSPELVSA
jgi:hypothetical protein